MKLYGHNINKLARYFNKDLNEKISSLGLYTSQWRIMLYLHEKKQCTQVELSHKLCVEAPTVTRTLTRMKTMGLISRKEGQDKREKLIELTEKAYEMYPRLYEESNSVELKALKDIDKEELEIFDKVLEKMMKNLEGE
ncbi:MarR family transcriptional regulator [Clostridium sardiniense]